MSALVWPSGYALPYGTPITFWGFAVDFLDGDISSKLVWVSSLDGRIGTGATFVRSLSSGAHTITVSATDSAGLTGKATISVVVAPPQ